MDLLHRYGHSIIPKGTILFRGFNDNSYHDVMFFGLQKYVITRFGTPQLWITKEEIKLPFLINEINADSNCKSSIPELYTELTDNTGLNDLEIKNDYTHRNNFINQLKELKTSGWLSSLENKSELEICLFNDNEKKVAFYGYIDEDQNKYNHFNSLSQISIFPSSSFILNATQNLNDYPFENYKNGVNNWINEEIEKGHKKVDLEHYCFNLRFKLKI